MFIESKPTKDWGFLHQPCRTEYSAVEALRQFIRVPAACRPSANKGNHFTTVAWSTDYTARVR